MQQKKFYGALSTQLCTRLLDVHLNMRSSQIYTKSKGKSKKTLFEVGQCKQNVSSPLKWLLVAYKYMT